MPVRVLIVDDSVFFRNRISLILKSHPGIEVIDVAKNGVEAVEKVQRLHPDVVTMDVEMPEMDGYTLTAELRRHPEFKDLHIILHTSLSGVFNQAMVERVGANEFIAKFNPDELGAAVKAAVSK